MGKALYNFIISKGFTVRPTRLHTIKKVNNTATYSIEAGKCPWKEL